MRYLKSYEDNLFWLSQLKDGPWKSLITHLRQFCMDFINNLPNWECFISSETPEVVYSLGYSCYYNKEMTEEFSLLVWEISLRKLKFSFFSPENEKPQESALIMGIVDFIQGAMSIEPEFEKGISFSIDKSLLPKFFEKVTVAEYNKLMTTKRFDL